jgi:HEAT repeat protein
MRHRWFRGALTLGTVLTLAAARVPAQDMSAAIAALRDPNAGRRIDALRQLNMAAHAPAAEYVAPLVTDPDDQVQFAAIDAELTFHLIEPVAERRGMGVNRSRAQEAFDAGPLVRSAGRAPAMLVDQLITAIADRNARIRFDALHALGVIAEPPLGIDETRRVMTFLQDPDPVIRTATARVLGRLRGAAAGDLLVSSLNDPSALVQTYAAEALGRIKHDRAVQALADRVTYYGKGEAASTALLALARIGHASSRDLFRARLADADAAIRRAAIEGLGRLRDRASIEAIRTAARADQSADVRLAGLFALDRLGEPQLNGIAMSVGQPVVGAQAADYLLEAGPAAAAAALATLSKASPGGRAELAHLIGFVGGAADARALDAWRRDADPRVARAAANAIARLSR